MKPMDLIIRNALIQQDAELNVVDIGIGGGAILTIGQNWKARRANSMHRVASWCPVCLSET